MTKRLPRRHFFDSYGLNNGVAYTNNSSFWKILDGKVVEFTSDHDVLSNWKREMIAAEKLAAAAA